MFKIGIIMPCYYSSKIIKRALTMLSWQTKKEYIKVYLVNDCSPNTNCDYQDLLDEFSNDLDIIYLKTQQNSGPGIARQLAMDNCDCDWIMFHDDDDMLNNPYVIEAFVNEIEKLNKQNCSDTIIGCIGGSHLQFWNSSSYFTRISQNLTGKLFNLNLIKLFDISYSDLSYEEDALFATQYIYYCERLRVFFPKLNIITEWTMDKEIPDFISYTKCGNPNSICGQLQEYDRCWKALKFLNELFNFYLFVPKDQVIDNLLSKDLQYDFNYLWDWVQRVQIFNLNNEQKMQFLEVHKKFELLLSYYPNSITKDTLIPYYNFVVKIIEENNCEI